MNRVMLGVAAGAMAALLGACGGGSGHSSPQDDGGGVPSSALASPEAFTAYAAALPASDAAEPLNLDKVDAPPTSETAEPAALD